MTHCPRSYSGIVFLNSIYYVDENLLVYELSKISSQSKKSPQKGRIKMLSREEQEAVDRWVKGVEPGASLKKETGGAQACQETQSQSCWFGRIIGKLKGNKK
jgi:hypothetical protein